VQGYEELNLDNPQTHCRHPIKPLHITEARSSCFTLIAWELLIRPSLLCWIDFRRNRGSTAPLRPSPTSHYVPADILNLVSDQLTFPYCIAFASSCLASTHTLGLDCFINACTATNSVAVPEPCLYRLSIANRFRPPVPTFWHRGRSAQGRTPIHGSLGLRIVLVILIDS